MWSADHGRLYKNFSLSDGKLPELNIRTDLGKMNIVWL
ncbi:Uncharacterized protein dnm_045020 [Desulfonema magnum]|uniref:Uncharacterized protein n=1 Tax=Desulfonema magnum TaxID=45655 RepID=A0A975BMW4_9BACT|nr:Uncharacterized protein dnm_045020 [Desulfonema magnum]